jgi:hypothetical protein
MEKPKWSSPIANMPYQKYYNDEDFMEVYQTIYKDCNGYMWYVQKHSDIHPKTKVETINFFTGTCKELHKTLQFKKKYLLLRAIHNYSKYTKPYILEEPITINEFIGKAVYVKDGFSICTSKDEMINQPFLHIINFKLHDQYFKSSEELNEFQEKIGKFIEEAINDKLNNQNQ